jgi:hypothetical protein
MLLSKIEKALASDTGKGFSTLILISHLMAHGGLFR